MKMFFSLAALFLLTAGFASAQSITGLAATSIHTGPTSDLTGFHATYYPGYNPALAKNPPDPRVVPRPEFHGVFVDGFKYGTIMISPTAPVTYGMGEAYLAAPSTRADLERQSGPAAHRQTGGIKLFSFEF